MRNEHHPAVPSHFGATRGGIIKGDGSRSQFQRFSDVIGIQSSINPEPLNG
jgi:hypothetical protein